MAKDVRVTFKVIISPFFCYYLELHTSKQTNKHRTRKYFNISESFISITIGLAEDRLEDTFIVKSE